MTLTAAAIQALLASPHRHGPLDHDDAYPFESFWLAVVLGICGALDIGCYLALRYRVAAAWRRALLVTLFLAFICAFEPTARFVLYRGPLLYASLATLVCLALATVDYRRRQDSSAQRGA